MVLGAFFSPSAKAIRRNAGFSHSEGVPPYQGITLPVTSRSPELPTTLLAFQVKYPQIV